MITTVRSLVLSCILVITGSASDAAEDTGSQEEYEQAVSKTNPKSRVWWAVPVDRRWTKFAFQPITGHHKSRVLRGLAEGAFSSDAGIYAWSDRLPEQGTPASLEGILLVVSGPGEILALRRVHWMVQPKGMGLVRIESFSEEEGRIQWASIDPFRGVLLPEDVWQLVPTRR